MKVTQRLMLGVGCLFAAFTTAYANQDFNGSEHKTIGDLVKVKIPGHVAESHYVFGMRNGVHVSYGDLVSMGDFFGIPSAPISKGASAAEREQRFRDAFQTVSDDQALGIQLSQIRDILLEEDVLVKQGIQDGMSPSQAFASISEEMNRKFNCVTGGGCAAGTWWMKPGRDLELAKTNYDHFGDDAWLAYQAGHTVAMRTAVEARQANDTNLLKRAYAMNAFACHFLTDRYASGHIRTPRYQLAENVTPAVIGGLLAKYMHDEDSLGLNVHNAYGVHWRAYGDGNFYEKAATEHTKHVIAAMQKSADEVYSAYQHGMLISDPTEKYMLPYADEDMTNHMHDVAALFYYDQKTNRVYRRYSLLNKTSYSWTRWWVGVTTLAKLAAAKGLPTHVQGQLAQSSVADQALKAGLITDKNVIAYMQKK